MAYVKIIYQNSPSTATPINAENLNHMDNQIALNDQRLTEIETSYVKSFNGRKGEVVPESGDYNIGQIAPLSGAQVGQVPVVVNHGTEEDPELVFEMGAGGGGGHSIIDSEGNTMPQETAMQFADSFVSDDDVNGKTVIENIKEHSTKADYDNATEDGFHVIDDGEDAVIHPSSEDYVEVTADGVKTIGALLDDLYTLLDFSKLDENSVIVYDKRYFWLNTVNQGKAYFSRSFGLETTQDIINLILAPNSQSVEIDWTFTTSGNSKQTVSDVPTSGTKITLYYGTSSTVINLKTDANYCQYDENTTVKQKIDGLVKEKSITETTGNTGAISLGLSYPDNVVLSVILPNTGYIAVPRVYSTNWSAIIVNDTTNNLVPITNTAVSLKVLYM